METQHFAAIIIGSGQAGNPLASAFAKAGKKVALIEKDKLGGVCVNNGCTPTKTYVASARAAWAARNAKNLGVNVSEVKVDLKAIKARKNKIVEKSRTGLINMVDEKSQIHLFRGAAKFADAKTVEVNGQKLSADQIFINVGARPRIVEGFEKVKFYTNVSLLEIDEIPEKLIVIGGSYIGLEFAQIFSRFGSKVTIVEMNDRLISREDVETSKIIANILENEGIELELGAKCIGGKPYGEDGVEVQLHCSGEQRSIRGSAILMATGRQSNADLLALHNAGIKHDGHNHIHVNEFCETNVKNIFAVGDCNGKGAFTHTAYNDFEIVNSYLNGGNRKLSDRYTNYALYIDPPMGRVGLSRDQALNQGIDILYGRMEMSHVARAIEKGETQGFMEVVIDKKSEKILGATVLGTGGDEIIAVFLATMYAGASYKTLRDSVQTHPTVSELIPTMLQDLNELKSTKK
ncbi:mercuric reductase [Cryomorpha ignava]|uniref:Mercuric reductase n=1 Tax=Cryomorpha ignava TaxID=101383 RepID=A0A7K3WVK2_9FLAO|nr:mercuric reductase [Cryomorpha ignava]NEN24952.1 mercuric reductase [Cryomorpha ignava]